MKPRSQLTTPSSGAKVTSSGLARDPLGAALASLVRRRRFRSRIADETRFGSWLIAAGAALVCLAGCAGADEPSASLPNQAPPPDYPTIAAPPNVFGAMMRDMTLGMPCPAPGLPPEVTKLIDCAAMRKVAGAASYAQRQVIAATLPPVVDLRERGLSGPVKNQAAVGACAGFAVSSVLDNIARRSARAEVSSALHIFSRYTGKGLEDLRGHPMTNEAIWPYDPARACRFAKQAEQQAGCGQEYGVASGSAWSDPGLLAEQSRADSAGVVRIDQFEELPEGIDPVQLAALLADGEALYSVMRFYRPAWESSDLERTGYLPYYPVEAADSYHAVTLEGYRWGRYGREFLIKNSWGDDWGHDGRAFVPETMLRTHMNWGYRLVASMSGAPTAIDGPASQPVGTAICLPLVGCHNPPAPSQIPWPTPGGALPLPAGLHLPWLR